MAPPNETPASKEHTLRIERVVAGGDGLARRPDGCVVFVPRTAPGDVVDVEYTEEHRNWRRARVVRVVEPGGGRRRPPCRYYERCGGCQLQHLDYPAQLDAKAAIVTDCLQRLGGVSLPDLEVAASPEQFAYRNKITLAARSSGEEIWAGYHDSEDPDEVVDIESCPLAEEPINTAWRSLRGSLRDIVRPGQAEARLTLRGTATGRVGLVIETTRGHSVISENIGGVAGLDAAWWVGRKGRIVANAGERYLIERWGRYELGLPANAFLQVNRRLAESLDAYVGEQCEGKALRTIVDAYCGLGLRSLELARGGKDVTAIDVDRRSVNAASRLASQHGIAVRFVAAAVERVLSSILPADVLILNPPRRGVAKPVIDALKGQPPTRVVYVSCDPATLARDIKGLGAHYQVTECRAFDLFPQTAHVETVATLDRSV